MEDFEGKDRSRSRNRNRKLRERGIVREKPIKPVTNGGRYNPRVVEVDDEVINLKMIRSLKDLPA
jgi:hypothetical protein